MALRYDRGTITNVERTPQGGMRCDAAFTRTGIFVYIDPDGAETREYRAPADVFDPVSIKTLDSAPITLLHPPGMVTTENFETYSRGHVIEGTSHADGDKIAGRIVIQSAKLLGSIDRNDTRELSCGYTCDLVPEPGTTPEGEKYDLRQVNIRYNHVAVVPAGRAGPDVALRLDAAGNQVTSTDTEKTEMKFKLNGVEYDLSTDQGRQDFAAASAALQAKADAAAGENAALRTRVDTAETNAKTAAEALATATTPARLDALAAERAQLHADARTVLGAEEKLDGLTEREIMVKVIAKARPIEKIDEKTSPAFISGLFRGLVGAAAAVPKSDNADVRQALDAPPVPGAAPRMDAHEKMNAEMRDGWKQPLAGHK